MLGERMGWRLGITFPEKLPKPSQEVAEIAVAAHIQATVSAINEFNEFLKGAKMPNSVIDDLLESPEALANALEDLAHQGGMQQMAEYICWAYAAADGGHAALAAGQLKGLALQAALAQELSGMS